MSEEKSGKKIFNKVLTSVNVVIAIIVLILVIGSVLMGWQPVHQWFQDYYNTSHDSRYEWAK